MSLRWKVTILLSGVAAFLVATAYAGQRLMIWPSFVQAERAEAEDDLARCVSAVRRDCEHLSTLVHDWASWDDTYRYMEDRNEGYEKENLVPTTFSNARLNLLIHVRPDGELVQGKLYDLSTMELIEAPGLFARICRPDHALVVHLDADSEAEGVLLTPIGPMLVASRPVLKSDGSGPIRGAVIMGRLLDDRAVKELAERTRVNLHVWPVTESALSDLDRSAMNEVAASHADWFRAADAEVLQGYAIIRDLFDQPALLLRADLPRTITQRGRLAARTSTASTMASGLGILGVLWLILRYTVINPLTAVTRHAVRVGSVGDLQARLDMRRGDEIGLLANEFDRMVAQLAESRAKLVAVARRAGMAEVATDVLHNVGNVLNSVNVSAGVVAEKLRQSEAPGLGLAAKMMLDHQQDLGRFITADERGRQLPGYLTELAKFLAEEQDTMLKEMKSLTDAIEHIKQIINLQQAHSKTVAFVEMVDPSEVLEEAIRLNLDSFERHHIELIRRFSPIGPVPLDRHKLLQVLVNLISNAKNAIKESGRQSRRHVTLRAEMVCKEDGDCLQIAVTDNGIGIAPENLVKIFAFGFSTRPSGHGIGLHSAANLVREMGGKLTSASEGLGRGATFTLELPCVRQEVTQ